MKKFLIRLLINAVAVYAAVVILNPHIRVEDNSWLAFVGLGLIIGLANALIRPVLKLLTCPLIILTLGLFTLLINTLMFWLAGQMGSWFGIGYEVDGFLYAFLGALIVSVISVVLSGVFKDDLKERRSK